MSGRIPGYFNLDRYGICDADIQKGTFGCDASRMHADVLITPCWSPEVFLEAATLEETVKPELVYTLRYNDRPLTLIRPGIGAPRAADAMLALGCGPCRRAVFVGSVGGLSRGMRIGDLLLPTESVSGDGFSSYLSEGPLAPRWFLAPAQPDPRMQERLRRIAQSLCPEHGASLAEGRVFSSDSIVAQFQHVDEIVGRHGCIGIEMETAAVFRAARLVGISVGALFQISDVTPAGKSLYSGRTEEDQTRRKRLRQALVSRIVLEALTEPDVAA
jgi:purine-nucleoside phosphorylase